MKCHINEAKGVTKEAEMFCNRKIYLNGKKYFVGCERPMAASETYFDLDDRDNQSYLNDTSQLFCCINCKDPFLVGLTDWRADLQLQYRKGLMCIIGLIVIGAVIAAIVMS